MKKMEKAKKALSIREYLRFFPDLRASVRARETGNLIDKNLSLGVLFGKLTGFPCTKSSENHAL